MPITSVQDFAEGGQYPPLRETQRIQQYERYYNWSNRCYVGLDPLNTITPQRQFANQAQRRRLSPNFFRFVMDFWSSAVSEPPVIEAGDNPRASEFLTQLRAPLATATAAVVGDMERYGVGVFYNRHPLIIESLDPRFWFPVAPPFDSIARSGDVIAYPYGVGDDPRDLNRLYIAEHTEMPRARVVKLDGLTIGETEAQLTNMAFVPGAVVPVSSGDSLFGRSTFSDIAEYVIELFIRESAIAEALDLHAKPHLAVPQGTLVPDVTGKLTLDRDGMVLPVPDGESSPQYVQWKADFAAHQDAIERAEMRIMRMAGISPVLAQTARTGEINTPSGDALRRLAYLSTAKVKVIRQALTEAYKRVIPAQAMLLAAAGGERIMLDDITVKWPPPFSTPHDEAIAISELVETGAMSRELALQMIESISRREARQKTMEFEKDGDNNQVTSS